MFVSHAPNPGPPSLFIIETGVALMSLALAFCWPRAGSSVLASVEGVLGCLAARRGLSILTVGATALLLRLALLPLFPVPEPFIHDEFSFLLAGDTFASGRLTNPTHQLWQHFESFHITQWPTYMSMYFPVQGLILAGGKRLTGNPWYGVCFSTAVMCSMICWTLQGWMRPGWALLGGMLAVLRLGLFSYWVNGYYGGAPAAIGGLLVLGALPRILQSARVRDGLLLATGAAVLANSRPWEGMLVCAPVAFTLIRWAAKSHWPRGVLLRRALAPLALFLACLAMSGYYNYRVFGNPLTLPYQVNRATYAVAPVFLWESPRPEPLYRHKVLREFYTQWELGDFLYAKKITGFLCRTVQKFGVVLFFYYGPAFFAPLVLLPRVFRQQRIRFLVVAAAVLALGLCVNAWLFPHYVAAFVGGLYVFLLSAMRYLRAWRPGGEPYGLAIVRFIPVVCVLLAGLRVFAAPLGLGIHRWPSMWYGTEPLGLERAYTARALGKFAGPQLAIVRYSAGHNVFDDWVYNAADIDKAKVVWAREMDSSSNEKLLKYFRDRVAWLVEPDEVPARITPYRRPE